jgi:putative ABC transport system substrate-binding protein
MRPSTLCLVIALAVGPLVPTPLAAQPARIVTIGVLAIEPWPPLEALSQGLRELVYVEGKNARFEHRYAEGRNERFPELAAELVGLKVDVIVTWGTAAALAAKRATATTASPRSMPSWRANGWPC